MDQAKSLSFWKSIPHQSKEDSLSEFKKRVADLNQEDVDLQRFLIARDFNIPAAESMLRKNLEWRLQNDMDNALKTNLPSFIHEDMPFKVLGCDYSGVKMTWFPAGRYKVKKWMQAGHLTEIRQYGHFLMETLREIVCSTPDRKPITIILDCEGLSFSEATYIGSLKFLHDILKEFEQNYPEILQAYIVINAPWVFTICFNFIKMILSNRTMSKIKIFGHNKEQWLPVLLKCAPKGSLPEEYFDESSGNE